MSTDLEKMAPGLFAIARGLRDTGATVRMRCIRVGVDENGDGGEIVAGAWPEDPLRRGEVEVNYKLRPPVAEEVPDRPAAPAPRYRGRSR